MKRFSNSFSAELKKIRSTKLLILLAIIIFIYMALMGGFFGAMFGAMTTLSGAPEGQVIIDSQAMTNMVYSSVASFGYVVPLLFGAIMATGEIRHKTISLAFLAEPKREIVLYAKLLVLVIFGALLGVAGVAGSVGAGAITLGIFELDTNLLEPATILLILRAITAIAIWAVIGFGLGLLIKNQAFSIVVALVFTQFLEPTLRLAAMFWEWSSNIAKFFPGAATDSFVGASLINDMSALDPTAPSSAAALGIWQGAVVLIVIAIVVTVLGWVTRWRGDVV